MRVAFLALALGAVLVSVPAMAEFGYLEPAGGPKLPPKLLPKPRPSDAAVNPVKPEDSALPVAPAPASANPNDPANVK